MHKNVSSLMSTFASHRLHHHHHPPLHQRLIVTTSMSFHCSIECHLSLTDIVCQSYDYIMHFTRSSASTAFFAQHSLSMMSMVRSRNIVSMQVLSLIMSNHHVDSHSSIFTMTRVTSMTLSKTFSINLISLICHKDV